MRFEVIGRDMGPSRKRFPKDLSECYSFPNALDYRGIINYTRSGTVCQKWTAFKPHSHTITDPNYPMRGLGDHNYCRNPDDSSSAWCYTTNPNLRWELCSIPPPQDVCSEEHEQPSKRGYNNKMQSSNFYSALTNLTISVSLLWCSSEFAECYTDIEARDYRGFINTTKNGRACQRWDQQSPHTHDRLSKYPDAGLVENFCRNPDPGDSTAWCYTTDPGKRYEECNLLPLQTSCTEATAESGKYFQTACSEFQGAAKAC
ncbi:plasminogen-like [Strongylocentrotus purpuratus]|uniref:Kringle domain-containing protein n=1 Tax=Strongylocentrotus purpuratus TaxID=7668 RepID=A0A7M7PDV3_STRPU|nr:plasminogen-like [Strongylocentrotus purpuratus]